MTGARYLEGDYLDKNPTWHVEDSPWKARQIASTIARAGLQPRTVAEFGCGAGEVLAQLHRILGDDVDFKGFDISPQAHELSRSRETPRLTFHTDDLLQRQPQPFDLMLTIDVIEHVEDCFALLRKLRPWGKWHIFHIPLDMSVQMVFRMSPIIGARRVVGHLHYFAKETALALLADTGYDVVAYHYTAGGLELPNRSIRQRIMRWPRRLAFAFAPDMTVRVLGGYSLMVLARAKE